MTTIPTTEETTMTTIPTTEETTMTTFNLSDEDRAALHLLREFDELTFKVDFWQGQDSEPVPYWTARNEVALDEDGEFIHGHGATAEEALRALHANVEKFSDREWAGEIAKGLARMDELMAPVLAARRQRDS